MNAQPASHTEEHRRPGILETTQNADNSAALSIFGGEGSEMPQTTGWSHGYISQASSEFPLIAKSEICLQLPRAGEHMSLSFENLQIKSHMQQDKDIIGPKAVSLSNIASEHPLGSSFNKTVCVPTRYIKVFNAPRDMSIWKAREVLKSYGDLKGVFTALLSSAGILFFEFFDIRHAMAASRRLHSSPAFNSTNICVQFCSKIALSQVSPDVLKSENEGILAISVRDPRLNDNDMLHHLESYGDIRSFQTESDGWPLEALVEFYDTRHAAFTKSILQELHLKKQIDCQVSFYSKSTFTSSVGQHQVRLGIQKQQQVQHQYDLHNRHHQKQQQQQCKFVDDAAMEKSPLAGVAAMTKDWSLSPGTHQRVDSDISGSPTDISGSPTDDSFAAYSLQSLVRSPSPSQSAPPIPSTTSEVIASQKSARVETQEAKTLAGILSQSELRSPSSKPISTQHDSDRESPLQEAHPTSTKALSYANAITSTPTKPHTKNITASATQSVEDKRTTYMIRNIPNKYTQQMLVECLNKTHFGKYDFLYLRMDFKNKCNVGYAFINFVHTDVVASFIEEHVGKRWSRFNSDKICRLSFAAIQGRQALIEKFRNSSVMVEDPSYQPKLFYTGGPKIGQVEPFPEPIGNDRVHSPARRRSSNGRQTES
ncbi:hypothetical protein BGZ49_009278 [Haplosporangium sp. Z 27]|nr:hypothetical protein BGZ49_009278 [Haplosporangium sp. Z 27]